jgi:hypothetical protein
MKLRISCFLFLICSTTIVIKAQNIVANAIGVLPAEVNESSGLIFLNGRLITHNDSGNPGMLYEIDTLSAQVLRSVVVKNHGNIDWEDICRDSNYIYIGDFGNNMGNRTNLRVLRISIADYLASDSVDAEAIHFSYADQTNFNPGNFSTNFDAEAIVCTAQYLYIFTKQWGKPGTKVYPLSKTPGTYSLVASDSLSVNGLITGADFWNNKLSLTGYTSQNVFILVASGFSWPHVSSGNIITQNVTLNGSIQVEAIAYNQGNKAYISSEQSFSGNGILSVLNAKTLTSKEELKLIPPVFRYIFSEDKIVFELYEPMCGASFEILSADGRLLEQKIFDDQRTFEVPKSHLAEFIILRMTYSGKIWQEKVYWAD